MSSNCVFCQDSALVSKPLFADEKINGYIKKVSKIKNLTAEEEQELARAAKDGDEKAKNKLIQANLK